MGEGTGPVTRRLPGAVLLLLLSAALLASPAGGQLEQDRSGLAYEPSVWWEQIERDVDPLIARERWRKARRAAEGLSDEIVRFSWRAPDIAEVLAAVAVRRAAIEAALGREEDALWLWWSALNLDPSLEGEADPGVGTVEDPDLERPGEGAPKASEEQEPGLGRPGEGAPQPSEEAPEIQRPVRVARLELPEAAAELFRALPA